MNLLKKLQNAPQINSNVANTIQGLGNLASSGSRISTVSDRASTSTKKLGNALISLKDKLKSAHKSSKGFVSSIGMFYAKFFLVIRAVKKFGQAIGSAQDLTIFRLRLIRLEKTVLTSLRKPVIIVRKNMQEVSVKDLENFKSS